MFHQLSVFITALLSFFLIACSGSKKVVHADVAVPTPYSADREFRAAWVATVANINWPSKPGLSTAQQQQEAINLLDFLKEHHFNAVIFQVRPQADALYQSNLEPWSYYLTGTQGKAPQPYYDPLQFWIDAAHKRGLELHVWLNPYRAHHVSGGPVTDSSIVKRNPELVLHLKEGYWWMDPAMKGTQDHSNAVVMDLVKRYDIDGVHFDDYFYPYPSYNKNEDFPDSVSWNAYRAGGGQLSRGDWRRKAVNDFISKLYTDIKKEKPHVKFGLSPFGIWRPGYPESVAGLDQYDVLYADARLWLNEGWVDYFSPQLYWPINRIPQSFPVLLGWWNGENKKGRHLWPGISVGGDTSAHNVNEKLSQIMISRGMLPQSKGVIHWSIGQVYRNAPMAKALLAGPYKTQALVPASPWLDATAPQMPEVQLQTIGDSVRLKWTHSNTADIFKWVVYYEHGNMRQHLIFNKDEREATLPANIKAGNQNAAIKNISVTAVDRTGNESKRREVPLTP